MKTLRASLIVLFFVTAVSAAYARNEADISPDPISANSSLARDEGSVGIAVRDLIDTNGALDLYAGKAGAVDISDPDIEYLWTSLGAGPNFTVKALAVDGSGNLYAGGSFTKAGGVSASRIAKWDGDSWSSLGSGIKNGGLAFLIPPVVRAIVVDGNGLVYVAGQFNRAGGQKVSNIAVWDGSDWSALDDGTNLPVHALAIDPNNNHVIAGGLFTKAGGKNRDHIAEWTGSNWKKLDGGVNGLVSSIVVRNNGVVFAGGLFTKAGGEDARYIAKWKDGSWTSLNDNLNDVVTVLAVADDGTLYAGGQRIFGQNSGGFVARKDGGNWTVLKNDFNGLVTGITPGTAGDLYVSGVFTSAGNFGMSRIAYWDGADWSALGSGVNGPVDAMVRDQDGVLFAGGLFNETNDVETHCCIARFGPNRTPAFDSGDSVELGVAEDAPAKSINTILSATDEDWDQNLTWTVITPPTKGILDGFDGSGTSNGSFVAPSGLTYTPNLNEFDLDSFIVRVSDGYNYDEITVNVNIGGVNDQTTANPDVATTPEDTPINIDVLANDPDVDGDLLTVTLKSQPSHGTVQVESDGSITYTPDENYSGPDRFDYTATDPSDTSDSEAVRITVTPVNDIPVAVDDSAQTDEDVPIEIDVLSNDSDVEGPLSVSFVGSPSHGQAVDNGNGTVAYSPDAGYFGSDEFTYEISDGDAIAQATVTVAVQSVNDAPIAADDNASLLAGESVTIDLLTNDSDPDGDDLSIVSIGAATLGIVSEMGDGVIIYTAGDESDGTDTFSYTITDPDGLTATVSITIVVTGPGEDGDSVDSMVESGAPNGGDGNDDGDLDADQNNVASFPIATGPNTGQYLTIGAPTGQALSKVASTQNPSPGDFPEGTEMPVGFLSYTLSNIPVGQSTIVTITLPVGVTASGYLKYGPTSDNTTPHWYSFVFDGTTGAEFKPGKILLHFKDGEKGDDDLTANGIIVDPGSPIVVANEVPVAVADQIITPEDTDVQVDVLANDSDPDGEVLLVMIDTQPAHGVLSTTEATGVFDFTPEPDFFGSDTFAYTIVDEKGASASSSVAITVSPVEDAPIARPDSAATGAGMSTIIPFFDNDEDPDGDRFWLAGQGQPSHGVSVYRGNGTIKYTPEPGFVGVDTWTYTITDGPDHSGQFVMGTIKVVVSTGPPPDPAFSKGETGSEQQGIELPTDVFLNQNYPNPFNPSTMIEFGLPETGHVRLELFDIQGRLVQVMVDNVLSAGVHRQSLFMGNHPSGTYIYRLSAGDRIMTKTLQLIR